MPARSIVIATAAGLLSAGALLYAADHKSQKHALAVSHQYWIIQSFTKPRQSGAHCRLTAVQSPSRCRDLRLRQQGVEHPQQVEVKPIDIHHVDILYSFYRFDE
jgi:hypothetical protein